MATDANPPYRFGGLLARARRSWVEQIRERMQEAGFPGYRQSDAWVLALLLQRPLAIGQLGEAQGISRQAARQMADGLVERGYATFGTDEADARRTLVVLTRRGKAYGRAIWMAQDALNEMVRSRVSQADLVAADAVLRAVFPDDDARQQVDQRMPPLSERLLSGRYGLHIARAGHQDFRSTLFERLAGVADWVAVGQQPAENCRGELHAAHDSDYGAGERKHARGRRRDRAAPCP